MEHRNCISAIKTENKKLTFPLNFLAKIIRCQEKDNLRTAFKMILIKNLDLKAQNRSGQKRNKNGRNLENRDLNRLMTFQDETESNYDSK